MKELLHFLWLLVFRAQFAKSRAAMSLEIKSDLELIDWEQLAHVYRRAFEGIQSAELMKTVFHNSYATRIALWNGEVVGGVYAFSDGVLDATIHGLAVNPEFQKRGIGRALMEALMSEFGSNIAVLLTAELQHQVIYRKFGFRPLKTAMALGFPAQDLED
ncbi:putative N-acetyltransferase YhbS [Abditibacterium utsteinense]|uniref:Putative N-acetyltransferase YhbS n=1 Tax=Abditibacterium utsteinense TaxID=1960156 RepID=A0A2S8SUL3_9BACT|nr:GNAT family N-acetyltransferase [Abditibacterium utsteinense]PQV64474.1 putative N-acetyltransferase YhbS [Abditibacterium utsteinense]